jgi:hypothetical protein
VKITMTVYAHANLDEKAAALDQLGAALLSPTAVKPAQERESSNVDSR